MHLVISYGRKKIFFVLPFSPSLFEMLSSQPESSTKKCGCNRDSKITMWFWFFCSFFVCLVWVFFFFFLQIEYISIFVNVSMFLFFVSSCGKIHGFMQSHSLHTICIHAFQWNFFVQFRFRALISVSNTYITHENPNILFLQFIFLTVSIHSHTSFNAHSVRTLRASEVFDVLCSCFLKAI